MLRSLVGSEMCIRDSVGCVWGGSSTSESGLPDWARPAVESSLNEAVATEGAGGFSHVQDLTPEQLDAFERRKELGQRGGVLEQIADSYGATQAYRGAASGTGLFGADAIGQQAQALEGTIGQAQQAVPVLGPVHVRSRRLLQWLLPLSLIHI